MINCPFSGDKECDKLMCMLYITNDKQEDCAFAIIAKEMLRKNKEGK